ncbi:hypothetical protein [Facklamia hominis]|uniref:hypothetical protein n=1 Tax=Facklamia hominis TaxID=178214 RepID=UPI00035474DF|nr:hypothetical protein [Facklamia hominis]EPH12830.1 hypothetical protein HMPREF9260_00418 [Facklamia hominis ACS-120-V-Sch10]
MSINMVDFAKEYGYETAAYLGVYQSKRVYEAIYRDDNKCHYIELPAFILGSNDGLEWIQDQRSFSIMNNYY